MSSLDFVYILEVDSIVNLETVYGMMMGLQIRHERQRQVLSEGRADVFDRIQPLDTAGTEYK